MSVKDIFLLNYYINRNTIFNLIVARLEQMSNPSFKIPLIKHNDPRCCYEINFEEFISSAPKDASKKKEPLERASEAAQAIATFSQKVLVASWNSAWLTCSYAGRSFKHLILSSYGITDIYLMAFKVAFWVFGLAYTFVTSAVRMVAKDYLPESSYALLRFLPEGIHVKHFQVLERSLDVTGVPQSIQIDNLQELFKAIEFDDPNKHEYCQPSFFAADGKQHTKQDLEEGLEAFIKNVKSRTPLIGTPPAHDMVRLEKFYQQIENAVRLCLHKTAQDLAEFNRAHGAELQSGDAEAIKLYKNIFEDRARLVVDLAIAGKHCGARYMGEAMKKYYYFYSESQSNDTLEGTLIALLGQKRQEIAEREVQKHFGQGRNGVDTHSYALYMEKMGGLLAIPGTENVIEHLGQFMPFDRDHYLREFFKQYNEKTIMEAVQDRVKKSGTFREQIFDWLKGQVGEWVPQAPILEEDAMLKLQQIIDEDIEVTPSQQKTIASFGELLKHLAEKEILLPGNEEGWIDFIDNLFAEQEVKDWFQNMNPGLAFPQKRVELMGKRNVFLGDLKALGEVLGPLYPFKKGISIEEVKAGLLEDAKVDKMRKVIRLDHEIYKRVLRKETDLKEVIEGYKKREAAVAFLFALDGLNDMENKGLPPLILEWLLDAHHIFVPKYEETVPVPGSIGDSKLLSFKNRVRELGKGQDVVNSRPIVGQSSAEDQIFNRAFNNHQQEVSKFAQKVLGENAPLYPRWKEVVLIDGMNTLSEVIADPILKVAISIYTAIQVFRILGKAYNFNKQLVDRSRVYLESNMPPWAQERALKVKEFMVENYHWIIRNRRGLLLYGLLIQLLLMAAPVPALNRLGQRLDLSAIIPDTNQMYDFLFSFVFGVVAMGWNGLNQTSSAFKLTSDRFSQEREKFQRKQAYSLWSKSLASS